MAHSALPTTVHPKDSTFSHKTRSSRTGVVLFVISISFFLPLSFYTFSYQGKRFTPLPTHIFSGKATCILYDRPPRTGSTTISRTLQKCVKSKGYSRTRSFPSDLRGHAVRFMVNSTAEKIALVGPHICMSLEDVKLLQNHCGTLLFITSTAPMKNRLLSEVKYKIHSHNGNSSLTENHLKRLRLILRRGTEGQEKTKERYPYCRNPVARKPPYALKPDYVIRSNHMTEDFPPLLEALGCVSDYRTDNVHATSFNKEELLSQITLKYADRSHETLTKLAEMNNEKGIRKALLF